jgi:hypothetical protein
MLFTITLNVLITFINIAVASEAQPHHYQRLFIVMQCVGY